MAGFDVTLMQRIAGILGRKCQLVPYKGTNFNDIFAGLDDGTYDCIASGTTITRSSICKRPSILNVYFGTLSQRYPFSPVASPIH
jgi:ABC-type amino acid transport substrate-binding protein